MACISPPELRDSDLLAYLDERSSDDVARHLDRCEHCRENLRRLAAEENRLTALLYRSLCPPSETLGEFHLNMLSGEAAAIVREHVDTCPHCTSELAQLSTFMGALESELDFGVIEQVKVLVARLLSGGGASGQMTPALAGLRGEADAGAYVYEAGDAQIVLHVQDDEQTGRKKVLGFISGVDADGAEVILTQEADRIASTTIDDLNNFVVFGVTPGTYGIEILTGDVEILTGDVEIHIQGVTV